ncbi:MAG: tetratricopeptide repeat protein [Gemmatimonadetes bacterium]|nr:tetratricopeptide repeat protein [Gemmatimonadota bacterium]
MRGYTTGEVADVLGISPSQVRAYARAGLLTPARGPRNEYRFSFQDIVVLRAAKELLAARIHPRKVRHALQKLRAQLPGGRPLTAVHVSTVGDRVVVRDRGTVWEPESGQVLFDFSVAELASRVAPFARRVVEEQAGTDADADDWYNLGFDLEAVAVDDASEAYRRALALEPDHADAHLNLGRLLHEAGDLATAEHHYRQALAAQPAHALAWYNLGVALDDRGQKREAIEAYDRATRLDPTLAAAHYNLARLYEESGKTAAAIRHFAAYKRLKETGG